ncbi:MAG: TonB-dependent receptor, partial [bacterium]
MVDGIPRFVGIWTHPLLDTMSIDFADRIDIYKSAQPVLFGNMSFGAVNVVPKNIKKEGLFARYRGSFGEYNTLLQQGEFGGRKDRWDFYLTGSYRRSDGHRGNADGRVGQFYGSVGAELNDAWSLSAQFSHSDGWANDPGQVGIPPTPETERYETNAQLYLIKLSHNTGKWQGDFKFYYDDGLGDWFQWDRDLSEPFRSVTNYDNYGFRFRERYIPWEKGELLFGYDHDIYGGNFVEKRLVGDRSSTELSFRNAAPYVMLSHIFGDDLRWIPSLGVRFNSSRYFGSNWGPQAGLSLEYHRTKAYANYAHGFNLPGVWTAISYGNWGRGDQWKELSAETVDHYEIGLTHAFSNQFRVGISFFHDSVEDALRLVPPPPPPPLFANIGDYTATGGEMNVEVMPLDFLLLYLGGNYTATRPLNI